MKKKKFCHGCIFEGDYKFDPYCLDVCNTGSYFPIIDCKKGRVTERKRNVYLTCKYFDDGIEVQLSLFDL